MRCKFSAFMKTCSPSIASSVRERSTGVRWATAAQTRGGSFDVGEFEHGVRLGSGWAWILCAHELDVSRARLYFVSLPRTASTAGAKAMTAWPGPPGNCCARRC